MLEFKRVLVTGGAGFIGSNFVRHSLARHPEWQIVVLDKLTYAGNLENLAGLVTQPCEQAPPGGGRVHFIHGDIAEPQDVARAAEATQGIDAIINFAAESHVDRSLLDARQFVRTNVEGTLVLLEHARKAGLKRFLQISTDEVYGDLSGTDRRSVESDPVRPRNPYAATKAAAEHLVFSYGVSYGLDVVITRGSNTYGPYQCPEKIIPLFITNAIDGRPLPLYGRGHAFRDYLSVADHCAGIDLVLHAGAAGLAYNLGALLEIPGVEVAERILKLLNRPASLVRFVKDRPGHDCRYAVDPLQAERLGWQRAQTWPDGLADVVQWYVANEGWWRRMKDRPAFQSHDNAWHSAGQRR